MKCSPSFAASTERPSKTACCAPILRSRRKAKRYPVALPRPPRPRLPPPLPTMAIARNYAVSAADAIASIPPAVRLRPSWRRPFKQGLAGPWATLSRRLHTCERRSHLVHLFLLLIQQFTFGLRRANVPTMKLAWLGCLAGGLLFAGTQDSDVNVNRRYTVDSVIVAGKGWRADVTEPTDKFSSGVRKELFALIGQKLNPAVLDDLSARLKKELSARDVSHHVLRADTPDHVRVEFEVKSARANID